MSEWRCRLTFKSTNQRLSTPERKKSNQNKTLHSVPKCVNQAKQNKRIIFQSGPASCTDEHRVGHMLKSSTALVAELQQRKTLTGWKKKKEKKHRSALLSGAFCLWRSWLKQRLHPPSWRDQSKWEDISCRCGACGDYQNLLCSWSKEKKKGGQGPP